MNFIIEQLPEQPVLYMRRIGAYGVENYELMAEMKKWVDMRGLFKDSIIYGIAWDNPADTPPEQCRYDVCLVSSVDFPADESVQRGEIPGGKYAVIYYSAYSRGSTGVLGLRYPKPARRRITA